jgi:3-hydroxyisobutyrate dehydrogenase
MASIGILGLGTMGRPIADRLGAAGFAVTAFDPAVGGTDDAAVAADVVLTLLPGRFELEASMPAVLERMRGGSTWIDLTSGDPTLSQLLADIAAGRGIAVVDSPMGGGPANAADGTLTFFVSGTDADVARVSDILSVLGTVQRAGELPGNGQTVKLLANLLWFGQVVAVTEALLLGERLGVSASTLRRILPSTAGASAFVDRHLDLLLDGDYAETFGLQRCVEELETLQALAAETGTPYELSTLVTSLHREALKRYGAVNGELLAAKLLEERAGSELRKS